MKTLLHLIPLSALALVCGCAIVSSRKQVDATTSGKFSGISYYLPKGVVQVDVTWGKDTREWVVKVTPAIIPDAGNRFELIRHGNALYDDDVTVTVDANGLLQSINATTEDKTAASLGDLASTVGGILTFGVGLFPLGPVRLAAPLPTSFHGVLDPYSGTATEVEVANVDGTNVVSAKFSFTVAREGVPPTCPATSGEGIMVRPTAVYRIDVSQKAPATTYSLRAVLPDISQQYVLPLSRRPFVKDTTKVILVSGMVQSVQAVRPSLVQGIIGVPKTIVTALVPIPLAIRQTQVNNAQAIDNYLKAQAEIKKLQGQ